MSLSPGELGLVLPYALGGFLLYAAFTAAIGALARDVESSRAWIFVLTLPMTLPIYLWMSITSSPYGLQSAGTRGGFRASQCSK